MHRLAVLAVLTATVLQSTPNQVHNDQLIVSLNMGMSSLNNDYSSVYMQSATVQFRLVDGFYAVGTIGNADKQEDHYLEYDYPLYTDTGLQAQYGEAGMAYRLWERQRPGYLGVVLTYRKAYHVDNEASVIDDTYFDGPRAQLELGVYLTQHMGLVLNSGISSGSGFDITGGIQFRY